MRKYSHIFDMFNIRSMITRDLWLQGSVYVRIRMQQQNQQRQLPNSVTQQLWVCLA